MKKNKGLATSKGLEWPMKRKGYKEISIKEKTFERLEEVRFEMGCKSIEELLNIWEDMNEEEDTTYCVNCGDHHD